MAIRSTDGLVTGVKVASGKSFGTRGRRAPKPLQDLTRKVGDSGSGKPSPAGPQSSRKTVSPDNAPQEAKSARK